jgi:hypothetical protein
MTTISATRTRSVDPSAHIHLGNTDENAAAGRCSDFIPTDRVPIGTLRQRRNCDITQPHSPRSEACVMQWNRGEATSRARSRTTKSSQRDGNPTRM